MNINRPIVYVLLFGVLLLTSCAPDKSDSLHDKAMWAWHPSKEIHTEEARLELVNFAIRKGIDAIYLYVGESEDSTYLTRNPDHYRSFIRLAHEKKIDVYALDGEPTWSYEQNEPIKRIEQILDYNADSTPEERFDGIQFDIEPYLLDEWDTGDAERMIQQYLDGLKTYVTKVHTYEKDRQFPFMIAIPFWFDSEKYYTTYDGEDKALSDHVMDIVNYVVIMAYRDRAEGKDSILSHTENEMSYAAGNGTKLIIGVETKGVEPEKVTFHEEGEAYMEKQLQLVEKQYDNEQAYGGVAIHHYHSYKKMKP
ncbi:hypothetical protein ACSVDE_12565 [Pseudalkalibacillus sp. Hm43]|uniref:hypothetical protein n=1 Tax=Pseudalkalibacillus sp. Hm43 TaxID=3450742 RepID=UPI003F435DC1